MNADLRVEVHTLSPMDSREDPKIHLRIEDAASGEALAMIEMSAGRWLSLISGLSLTLPGSVSDHLERVGRKQRVRNESIPRSVTGWGAMGVAAAREYAEGQRRDDETVEVRNSNSGWVALFRSWPA